MAAVDSCQPLSRPASGTPAQQTDLETLGEQALQPDTTGIATKHVGTWRTQSQWNLFDLT